MPSRDDVERFNLMVRLRNYMDMLPEQKDRRGMLATINETDDLIKRLLTGAQPADAYFKCPCGGHSSRQDCPY